MFNNPYSFYNPQNDIDKINAQINELEKRRSQIQQPIPITQNFQLAPTRDVIRYANSLEEVNRDVVIGETPYFSKDMSVVWIKNAKGEIKTYELTEIIPKDDKDIEIEALRNEIDRLRKEVIKNDERITNANATKDTTNTEWDDEEYGTATKEGKPNGIQRISGSKKKQ